MTISEIKHIITDIRRQRKEFKYMKTGGKTGIKIRKIT